MNHVQYTNFKSFEVTLNKFDIDYLRTIYAPIVYLP